jgi:hypothetical protein
VQIENELHRRDRVKISMTFGRFLECHYQRIDDVRDWNAILQDRLLQLTIGRGGFGQPGS